MEQFQGPLHGTAIEYMGMGYLLIGPSGSGKSDLALRMIHNGATLIADDYVALTKKDSIILMSPPPTLEGILEIRGTGLVQIPFARDIPLKAVIRLQGESQIPRLPSGQECHILDTSFPEHMLDPSHPSALSRLWAIAMIHTGRFTRLPETFLPEAQYA